MTELHPCAGCVQPQQFEVVAESCAPIERLMEWYLNVINSQVESAVAYTSFAETLTTSGAISVEHDDKTKLAAMVNGVNAIADIMVQATSQFQTMQASMYRDSELDTDAPCLQDGVCSRVAELFVYRTDLYALRADVENRTRAEFSKMHTIQ